ncbi:MAG: DegV family protein [Methanobacteriota archaeon]|nr:MAG: DegV family protein [Euryarchaeota archaeon]
MDASKIGILIDSALDVDKSFRLQNNVKVVPVYVNFGEKSYKDRVDLSIARFFDMIDSSKNWPTTSQPPPSDFYQAYKELSETTKEIYSFHVSSKLSGTIQSARIASEEFMDDHPDVSITIIDTLSVSIGGQIIIEKFLQLYQESKTTEEIWEPLDQFIHDLKVFLSLYTLKYLVKGGRLKKSQSFIANLFNIKPVLVLEDGELKPFVKTRGYKACVEKGIELAFQNRSPDEQFKFVIAVIKDQEYARELKMELENRYPKAEGTIISIGPALAVHAGPRAVCCVAYNV